MLQPDFSDYLENICRGIKSRPKREEIMEELLCHLEANYERNLAVGMSEDEAKKDAIGKMGDSETLSYRLAAVHSYSPLKAMNSAFFTLSGGYICMNFFLSGIVKDILLIPGALLIFSSLLRMRKMNAKTEKAFHLFNFSFLARFGLYCLRLGRIPDIYLECGVSVLIFVFQGFFWFYLLTGLDSFSKTYLNEGRKKPHLYFCGVYHLLLSFFNGFVVFISEGEDVKFDAFLLPFFIIFMYFYGTVQLIRMRNILWDADGEYGILPADKRHIMAYICVVAVCFLSLTALNFAVSTRNPIKTELVIHDVTADEQKQADEIRQKMLEWDVDAQIVEDLPDSEVLKYKDATFVTWGADGGSMGGARAVFGADSTVWYYLFYIPDENYEGAYEARLLCYIESNYADSIKSLYRKGFYYIPWGKGTYPLNLEDDLNGSFISIITEENNKKYTAKPFFTYNLTDENVTSYPKGFEYREEKGQRVYYATQLGITNLIDTQNLYAATVRQRWFCTFNYSNTSDFTETIMNSQRITVPSGTYLPYYWRLHHIISESFFEGNGQRPDAE